MTLLLAFLIALSVIFDVSGQICFKRGVDSLPKHEGRNYVWLLWRSATVAPWLWLGIVIYSAELVIWLNILARAPLSLAFPLGSLNFCGVVLASRLLLGERVPGRRWLGAGLITIGVAIVGASAGS